MNKIQKINRKLLIKAEKVNEIGQVYLQFSEDVWELKELGAYNSKMFHQYNLIEITYQTEFEGEKEPHLIDWEVLEFTKKDMLIQLQFNNSNHVSKGLGKDQL